MSTSLQSRRMLTPGDWVMVKYYERYMSRYIQERHTCGWYSIIRAPHITIVVPVEEEDTCGAPELDHELI